MYVLIEALTCTYTCTSQWKSSFVRVLSTAVYAFVRGPTRSPCIQPNRNGRGVESDRKRVSFGRFSWRIKLTFGSSVVCVWVCVCVWWKNNNNNTTAARVLGQNVGEPRRGSFACCDVSPEFVYHFAFSILPFRAVLGLMSHRRFTWVQHSVFTVNIFGQSVYPPLTFSLKMAPLMYTLIIRRK